MIWKIIDSKTFKAVTFSDEHHLNILYHGSKRFTFCINLRFTIRSHFIKIKNKLVEQHWFNNLINTTEKSFMHLQRLLEEQDV